MSTGADSSLRAALPALAAQPTSRDAEKPDDTTAIRYATAARQLLDTAAGHDTPG